MDSGLLRSESSHDSTEGIIGILGGLSREVEKLIAGELEDESREF